MSSKHGSKVSRETAYNAPHSAGDFFCGGCIRWTSGERFLSKHAKEQQTRGNMQVGKYEWRCERCCSGGGAQQKKEDRKEVQAKKKEDKVKMKPSPQPKSWSKKGL